MKIVLPGRIELPEKWEWRYRESNEDFEVAQAEGVGGAFGVVPYLIVRCMPSPAASLEEWNDRTEKDLRTFIPSWVLIDVGWVEFAGKPAILRVGSRTVDGFNYTQTQYLALDEGVGSSLTFTCSSADYVPLSPVFARCAQTWRASPLRFDNR